MKSYRALLGPVAVILLFMAGMYLSPFEPHRPPVGPSGAPLGEISWNDEDWDVLAATVRHALEAGADTLPMGEAMGVVGRSLVGTAYVPRTLEVDGPERLVINFRGLDCVTFVENVWATAALLRAEVDLGNRGAVETEYERLLSTLRYRNGFVDGYASRLHYFTDWIADGEQKLVLDDVTAELGGVEDREPIDFMSTHPEAYRQLSDVDVLEAIADAEARLTARGRVYLPQDRIEEASPRIREGDHQHRARTRRGPYGHRRARRRDAPAHARAARRRGGADQRAHAGRADRLDRLAGRCDRRASPGAPHGPPRSGRRPPTREPLSHASPSALSIPPTRLRLRGGGAHG